VEYPGKAIAIALGKKESSMKKLIALALVILVAASLGFA
jgi:hypothetical protein